LNTKFESILLKSITHDDEVFSKLLPLIEVKYFQEVGDQETFKLIKQYFKEYRGKPSLTELVALVKGVSNGEIRQSIIDSLQIISGTELVENVDFMCSETVKWIKDSLYLEALQIGSEGLMKKSDELKLKAQQILEQRSKINIDTDLGVDFDDIEQMIEYYSERNVGILTQHEELNKRLGSGFLPGTLSVVLAPAGGGKSLFLTDLISGMIKDNKKILLVSLEMQDKEIMKRVHANALNLPINSLMDLNKTEAELARLVEERESARVLYKDDIIRAYNSLKTSGSCGKLYVKDYPAGTFSALQLEQLVETYKMEKGIEFDLVFIDYIGIMKSDLVTPAAGLYSYVKSIGEEVRASAKKLKLPIISCSQLNRSAYGNKEASNDTISDSIGTAQTADWMLFLLQTEEMKATKEIICKVTKNRFNGITDTWKMNIDYEHMRFMAQPEVNKEEKIKQIEPYKQANNPTIENFGIGIEPTEEETDLAFAKIQAKEQKSNEVYADEQIKEITNHDFEILARMEPKIQLTEEEQMMKDLGL